MANLYLTEQNSVLRKRGDRLIVEKDDTVLLDVQCHKLENVFIFGNVQFTTQAVHELFEHGIEMAILSRTGRLIGQITSPVTKNIFLRIKQFEKYKDDAFRLDLSKIIVRAKIANGLNLIRNFSYNHPDIDVSPETAALSSTVDRIPSASRIDELLGVEGNGAKIYFTAFSRMILSDFKFPGRKKHPATDPVNAMLSLTYTMIFNEISSLLDGMGFDPFLGFFHEVDYGRPSLAADLVEEFRAPVGDRLTLNLVNQGVFRADDFQENPKGGVYFKRDPLKRYFSEYEAFINKEFTHPATRERTTLRKCVRSQAEKMAQAVQHDAVYVPFVLEG
ncbi:MAG: CRISPR-associated endonuclease Cas1 [Thermodesulfobacteriota bacterium]